MADTPSVARNAWAVTDYAEGQYDAAIKPQPLNLAGTHLHEITERTSAVYALGRAPFSGLGIPAIERYVMRDTWFDRIHVIPRSVTIGNVLSTVVVDFDVYNAFLTESHTWQNLVNNLGSGVSFTGLPSLPVVMGPQSGFSFTMEVSPLGAATIDSTLDFDFDLYTTTVPVTGSRIVMFPYRPQMPLVERLQFLSMVIEAIDGSEQRAALRRAPRQQFDFTYVTGDGVTRQRIDNLLFDWMGKEFGIPMWHEPAALTSAASSGAFSINVDSTSYADYRTGGRALVMTDEQTFDALEIASIGANSLTFVSALTHNYVTGTKVYPLRSAVCEGLVKSSRYAGDGATFTVRFITTDNDVDLASTAAFSTLNSKTLLDDNNFQDQVQEMLERKLTTIDNFTGTQTQSSSWDHGKRSSSKVFFSQTRQRTWEVRRLLHALKGRVVSFYMPNRAKDLTPTTTISNGATTLNVQNTGYARFIRSRKPRDLIRLNTTAGVQTVRTVTNASEIDVNTEQLTISVAWSATVTVDEVERIETLELMRIDSDEIELVHGVAGDCEISFPTKVVFE